MFKLNELVMFVVLNFIVNGFKYLCSSRLLLTAGNIRGALLLVICWSALSSLSFLFPRLILSGLCLGANKSRDPALTSSSFKRNFISFCLVFFLTLPIHISSQIPLHINIKSSPIPPYLKLPDFFPKLKLVLVVQSLVKSWHL